MIASVNHGCSQLWLSIHDLIKEVQVWGLSGQRRHQLAVQLSVSVGCSQLLIYTWRYGAPGSVTPRKPHGTGCAGVLDTCLADDFMAPVINLPLLSHNFAMLSDQFVSYWVGMAIAHPFFLVELFEFGLSADHSESTTTQLRWYTNGTCSNQINATSL